MRVGRLVAVAAVAMLTASCSTDGGAEPSATPTPLIPSPLATTVSVPITAVEALNLDDPGQIAGVIMFAYAAGRNPCAYLAGELEEQLASKSACNVEPNLQRLPVVTPRESCELPDHGYRGRFDVIPGISEYPMPITGDDPQHFVVDVQPVAGRGWSAMAYPRADNPAASCSDSAT